MNLPFDAPIAIALLDLLVVVVLTVRRVDVRLVLMVAAVPLFLASSGLAKMLEKLVAEMSSPGTVVPICSALGFAHVLRLTGCDQHLVHLLLRPLRKLHWLLIPGGIAAGYVVNTTIVSQTGTAAVIGPILIPLLRAGHVAPATAGAILLIGSSMGGELFNPGAVEMRKLAELTGLEGPTVVARSTPYNLLACGTALLAFWCHTLIRLRGQGRLEKPTREPVETPKDFTIQPIKALVPVVPLILLFTDPLLGSHSILHFVQGPPKILAAMLIGVAAAAISSPRAIGQLATSFFEGAGYAYTHVISLIVAASTYAEGIRLSGLIGLLVKALVGWPDLALTVGLIAPWTLAVISGTGIAPAVSIMEFFIPVAPTMHLDPVRLGTVAALGSHFGRTMSPAAAVVAMCAQLSGARPTALIREVAVPLFVGGAVLLAALLLGIL